MNENETRMGIVTTMICENGDGEDNIGETYEMFHAKKHVIGVLSVALDLEGGINLDYKIMID
jgi:hypothetical protein